MSAASGTPSTSQSDRQTSILDLRDEFEWGRWFATLPESDRQTLSGLAVIYLPTIDTLKFVFTHETVPSGAIRGSVSRVTELIQRFYAERRRGWLDGMTGASFSRPAPRELVMPRLEFEVAVAPESSH